MIGDLKKLIRLSS